jgi:hypothetical protein
LSLLSKEKSKVFAPSPVGVSDLVFEHFHLAIFAVESVVGERRKNAVADALRDVGREI